MSSFFAVVNQIVRPIDWTFPFTMSHDLESVDQTVVEGLCKLLHTRPDQLVLDRGFVANGGDSLLAIKLRNVINKQTGAKITVANILQAKKLADVLAVGKVSKPQDVQATAPTNGVPTTNTTTASREPNSNGASVESNGVVKQGHHREGIPMAEMQAGTMFNAFKVPGYSVVHITEYCYTDLLPQLKEAWRSVISQEEIFKTEYEFREPTIIGTLRDEAIFDWEEQSTRDLSLNFDADIQYEQWLQEASHRSLFRVITPAESYPGERTISAVHWFVPHAFVDGQSMEILWERVEAVMRGEPLPKPGPSFCAHVEEFAAYREPRISEARAYWAARDVQQPLGTVAPRLLPSATLSKPVGRYRMTAIELRYHERPEVFSTRSGYTFEVLVRSAWSAVLSKIQDTDTGTIMYASSRRAAPMSNLKDVVGCVAGQYPMRVHFKKEDTAKDLFEHISKEMASVEDVTYSEQSDGFGLGYPSLLTSDSPVRRPSYSGPKETEHIMNADVPVIYVRPDGRIRLTCNKLNYSEAEMNMLAGLLKSALFLLSTPEMDIGHCLANLVPFSQRSKLMEYGNCHNPKTSVEAMKDDLISLWPEVVSKYGNLLALHTDLRRVTYSELDSLSNIIADHLRSRFQPNSVISLHADGSVNWIIATVGIIRAGCIFSPQGEKLPHTVRSENYSISSAKAFMVPHQTDTVQSPDGCLARLCVDELLANPVENPPVPTNSADYLPKPWAGAYICFTSGSTGKPKGVICTHGGAIGMFQDLTARLHAGPGKGVAQILAPAFDGACLEIFSALFNGGTLLLKHREDPFGHLKLANSCFLTPSLATELDPHDFPHMEHLYLGSEVLPQPLADAWSSVMPHTYDIYGPTECSMVACAQVVRPGRPVTIGKPFDAVRFYILDRNGTLLPPHCPGELYIAGTQVALGYIGRPEETRLRFCRDTICPSDNGLMYKTGDWAYWNEEGEVAFQGRRDRQVKLNAFRIDLNDVQSKLEQRFLPPSSQLAVVVKDSALACVVAAAPGLDTEEFLKQAAAILPPHAAPKEVKLVEKMPHTQFGKIDYIAAARIAAGTQTA